jgi:predicted phage tail protein
MTNIYLHGILGKIFGKLFKIKVPNIISAVKAIEANRDGFILKLKELSAEGYNYIIVADDCKIENPLILQENKKINSIHFVPCINGSGPVSGPAALVVGSTILGSTMLAQVVAFAINMIVFTAISLGVCLIANALTKKSGTGPSAIQNYVAIAGVTSMVENIEKSYVFTNYINYANQGASIPIGYGALKVSSHVISASVSSYPQNSPFSVVSTTNLIGVNSDFLAN